MEKQAWVIEKDSKQYNPSNPNSTLENYNLTCHKNKRFKAYTNKPSQERNFEKNPRFSFPYSKVKYGDIFTADIGKKFGKIIRNKVDSIIFHRFHIKGICDTNCRMKDSHKKISKEKMDELLESTEFSSSRHPKFKRYSQKSSNTSLTNQG